jgi:hypothetical protein
MAVFSHFPLRSTPPQGVSDQTGNTSVQKFTLRKNSNVFNVKPHHKAHSGFRVYRFVWRNSSGDKREIAALDLNFSRGSKLL